MMAPRPEDQKEFWDEWNTRRRMGAFTDQQKEQALNTARKLGRVGLRILDAGCGTGWLGAALKQAGFGQVIGIDLSEAATAQGRREHPGILLYSGDFCTTPTLYDEYDLIVSADAISHVPSHATFIERVADLLRPGGTFLLMTQNPFVWRRSSYLEPQRHGQIRNWPSRARLLNLMEPYFTIVRFTSIHPGGNRGVLFWVNNRLSRLAWQHIKPWRRFLEWMMLGREFVIEARRR